MGILILLFLLSLPVLGYLLYKQARKGVATPVKTLEYVFIAGFTLSFLLFCCGLMVYAADYYTAIDIVDGGYSPFASRHLLSLITFFVLAVFGILKLWLKGRGMPPLLFVLMLVFVLIGIPVSATVFVQISHNTESYDGWLFGFLPFAYMITAVAVICKCVVEELAVANDKVYRNKVLNYLNQKMAKTAHQPFYVLVLLIPVFVIIVALLILCGQEADSMSKVFTETTTWRFSTKTHPPFLDHQGHYLCTVAACGDPKVVKPLRLGRRHGHEIIVNRQLLIANAFEALIQENLPAAHRIIRSCYDKYGYPLSKKITSKRGSNLVYRLMKPLEYFFLLCLYLCSTKPEEKIAGQYAL
ncbi:hypothetical protein DBR43_27010 [Pedobacter sp. KBW06]|uniref:DUF6688 domain-containing protein n=1 Tax=Pedobacter sp. KBW06 TaxID=2153359 RepID=UPI000F59D059|nr:DUF6688 family protein [Pedobacter sp. KBW06]RQO65901.1 hypothetical protein DBR43_27010 [Pedobacter sp. KBW06]